MISSLILFVLKALTAFIIPAAAYIYLKRKYSARGKAFFGGVAVYVIFYCLIYTVLMAYLEVVAGVFDDMEGTVVKSGITIAAETLCVAVGYLVWFKAVMKREKQNVDGIMAGAGFSSCLMALGYGVSAVVNAIISAIYIKNQNESISVIFEENVAQVADSSALYHFYDLLIMLMLFITEIAFAVIFYRVLKFGDKKLWLVASVILRMAFYAVRILDSVIDKGLTIVLMLVVTVIITGAAYGLIKPFVFKKDED